MIAVDVVGKRFGRLVALRRSATQQKPGRSARWVCLCDCGSEKEVDSYHLRNGKISSCGCIKKEQNRSMFIKHGMSKSNEWSIWAGIKSRCYNKKNLDYATYGARGIRVCDEWLNDFSKFFSDMGPRPSKKHSVERLDVNSNYSPENCIWATHVEQCRNKRDNVWVEIGGERKLITEWIREIGINKSTFYKRIERGMSIESALLSPT